MLYIKKLYFFIADILFPPSPLVKRIEEMDPLKFRAEAPSSDSYEPNLRGSLIYSIFEYRYPLTKEAIWQLKYKGNRKIIDLFAQILYEEIIAELEDRNLFDNFKKPLLIPIPMSKGRKRKRGWDQMELLGRKIGEIDGETAFVFSPSILLKTKETPPQATIRKKEERLRNLRNCFEVNDKEKIRNRNIILIDDVLTTGATIEEAKRTLMKAGAKSILSFTLAH